MRATVRKEPPRLTRAIPLLLLAGFWLCLQPTGSSAQQVRGVLLESQTRTPIPWGSVALLDSTYTEVVEVVTNDAGAFSLQAPGPGSYYVLGESLGYEPSVDGILELGPGGSVTIEFFLRPKPLEMDSLVVALTRHRVYRNLSAVGYYDRLDQGFGTFISPEEVEKRNPRNPQDLLRGVPGIHLGTQSFEGTRVYLMRGGTPCNPRVYVDGMQMFNDRITVNGGPIAPPTTATGGGDQLGVTNPPSGVVFEHMVSIEDVAAVEVHTRATSIPLLYGGLQEGCGVILVWTHTAAGKTP